MYTPPLLPLLLEFIRETVSDSRGAGYHEGCIACSVFRPVQSSLLPFFEATRPQTVADLSDFAQTTTETDSNQLHAVA